MRKVVRSERNVTSVPIASRTYFRRGLTKPPRITQITNGLGVPIRGDIKYGSKRTNPDGAIDLHAYKLHFKHPVKEEYMKIIAPLPEDGLWKHVDAELIKSF